MFFTLKITGSSINAHGVRGLHGIYQRVQLSRFIDISQTYAIKSLLQLHTESELFANRIIEDLQRIRTTLNIKKIRLTMLRPDITGCIIESNCPNKESIIKSERAIFCNYVPFQHFKSGKLAAFQLEI